MSEKSQPGHGSGRGEAWFLIQVILLLAILVAPGWSGGSSSPILIAIGLISIFVGLAIVLMSSSSLGVTFSVFPRPVKNGHLTQTGLYAQVRHPIYCGLILTTFGWAIFRLSLPAMILTIVLFAFLDRKAAREEKWLTEKYPEYAEYRQRVHKLIPFIY